MEKDNQIRESRKKGLSKEQCLERIKALKRAIEINKNCREDFMKRQIREWQNEIKDAEIQLKFWEGKLYKFQEGVPENE